VSISSISHPTALLGQVASKNPLVAAASYGARSFASTLMHATQPSGSATATGGTTTATGTLQALAHHRGHHAGGAIQSQLFLQSLKSGASAAPGRLLSTAA